MTAVDPAAPAAPARRPPRTSILALDARTRRRNAAEARFRLYGLGAIGLGVFFLVVLLGTILFDGLPAFRQAAITLPVQLDPDVVDPSGNRDPAEMAKVTTFGYGRLIETAMTEALADRGVATTIEDPKVLAGLFSDGARATVRDAVLADPALVGQTVTFHLLTSSRIDGYMKGRVTRETAAADIKISPEELDLADAMIAAGLLSEDFNPRFVTGADSSEARPEQSGIGVAVLGSLAMMLVVLATCLPVSVAASIYLEEFAPKNRLTDLIEVSISNLAAVPSIVFGILGLALFIQFLGMPQSAPLVGGLVLSLMTLPTMIIATRAALRAVPPSIREAALGVGASRMQAVFHHVLPLAAPGILTGTIIGMAAALGETAPLLFIGMVGYVARNAPDGVVGAFMDPNSAIPAQVYTWASRADPAWYERAWGGIIVLLLFLVATNALAILLRRRFERRW